MDGQIRNFTDIKQDKFDEEGLITTTSKEQVSISKICNIYIVKKFSLLLDKS